MQHENRRAFLATLSGAAVVPAPVAAVATKSDWYSIPVADNPYETESDREGTWLILRHGKVAIRAFLFPHPPAEPEHEG